MASPAELRAQGRDIAVPFVLALPTALGGGALRCERVLRCLPGRRIVALAYTGDGEARVVKLHLVDGARALARERDGLAALAAAGFVVPTQYGAACIDAEAGVQVAAFVDDARPLSACWPTFDGETRRRWLEHLGARLARLHARGALHDDPHLDNFLLAGGVLHALDGGALRCGAVPPTPARALRNLALLHAQLPPDDDALAQSTLDAYSAAGATRFAPAALRPAIARARARRIDDVVRKSMRDCTAFAVQRADGAHLLCRRTLLPTLLPLLHAPDEAMRAGEMLKDGNTATVVRVRLPDGSSWIVKRYNIKDAWHRVSRALRRTRAEASWCAARRLELLDIPVADAVALRVERAGPLRGRAYLVMADAGGTTLDEFARQHAAVGAALQAAVATLVVRLHGCGLLHGDLKASNVLVTAEGPRFIDLDAVRVVGDDARACRAQAKERARFLANWHGDAYASWARALAAARHAGATP